MRSIPFIIATILCSFASTAQAQPALDSFLDKIEAASELPDCTQTQTALAQISDDEFNAAIADIKITKNQSLLVKYKEKFSKIEYLTAKCPKVHDRFANKMSMLTVHAHLTQKQANPDSIRTFVNRCEEATRAESCKKSAEMLSQFPTDLCENAIVGFQNIQPSAFSDEEYKSIQEKLTHIINWSKTCPEYKLAYDSCLTPKTANFQNLSRLQPFFDFLHDLKTAIQTTDCDKISNLSIDKSRYQKAIDAMAGLSPAHFSPADRAAIRSEMHAVYDAAKTCAPARAFIDSLVENMFPGK